LSDWLTITGVRPYDGRYELDLDGQPLTTREWGWVKKYAGYLPLTLTGEAFTDPELIAVLAIVAARRAGVIDTADVPGLIDRLADAPFGTTITLDTDDQEPELEGDAGPPPGSSGVRPSSDGASSPTGSVSLDGPPTATGGPPSATSPLDPLTLAS
jgi:hypothetical protein